MEALVTSLATPFSAVEVSVSRGGGFLELDTRVESGSPGHVAVVAGRDATNSLIEHLTRRAALAGHGVAGCLASPGFPAFHQAALALGATTAAPPADPHALAEGLLGAAAREPRRVVVIVPLPAEGSWDHAVLAELLAAPRALLLVVVSERSLPRSVPPPGPGVRSLGALPTSGDTYELEDTLTPAEQRRYLSAVLDHATLRPPGALVGGVDAPTLLRGAPAASLASLAALAARVDSAVDTPARAPGTEARELVATLRVLGVPWPTEALDVLGFEPEHAAEALAAGELAVHDRRLWPVRTSAERPITGDTSSARAAEALLQTLGHDGWALGRAAELLLDHDLERADTTHTRALEGLADPLARRELRRRWMQITRSRDGLGQLVLRAALRALDAGEPEEALRCAEACAPSLGATAEHCLVVGRARVGMGDLVGGRVAFDRARARDASADGALEAPIAVELADVAYAQGAFDRARVEANLARIASRGELGATLRASNVLGKILLAEGKWDEADAHFADDAMAAAGAGLTSEGLRARLNRAIAVQSKGLLDEADAMLRELLRDAEAASDERAMAYALTNLAVVAWTRHDYGTALDCLERTFAIRRALGSPATISHTVASLAELRLRLGLYEHARHTLTFGRRAGMNAATASQFALVAAHLALARGDTLTARREIEAAIADASATCDQEWLGEARRVAARVALEDGDIAGCTAQLERAAALGKTDRALAEHALLAALATRASGATDLALADLALRHGRASGDEELLCEIMKLLALAHRDAGDLTAARGFCGQALQIRDRVSLGLRDDVRAAFLQKPEWLAMGRLAESLGGSADAPSATLATNGTEPEPPDESPRTERSRTPNMPARPDEPRREIVGDSPQIRALVASIRKVGRSSATVLIRGESGTGKELVAEALHRASDRANGPLVSLNCAALVESLLLSELFGHEKGAFTGATARRRGRFELAEGGTLFLDEIGDISPRTQVALLRVLQERTFERVGGTTPVRANVRVICATHRDLRAMVDRGEFREDLYYRLQGIQLEVPALRARLSDVPRIAESLLARIAQERGEAPKRLDAAALEVLQGHRWPGNIRELENALRAGSLFAEGEVIGAADLLENVEDLRAATTRPAPTEAKAELVEASTCGGDDDDAGGPLPQGEASATAIAYAQVRHSAVSLADMKRQIERDCIARALVDTKGNITRAAALLGMKRPRLSQLVKQYGLAAVSSEGV